MFNTLNFGPMTDQLYEYHLESGCLLYLIVASLLNIKHLNRLWLGSI